MAHKHSVYDSDSHFMINPTTRVIKGTAKNTLIQLDHNSERFTFELPRLVEGHDMSVCDKVEVHFLASDSATGESFKGLYEVNDLQVSPDSDDVVIFSWLISQNATQYVGTLSFLIRFVCLTDDVVDYAWHTAIYSGISISSSYNHSATVAQEYVDLLEQWRQKAPEIDLVEDAEGVTITVTDQSGTQSAHIDKIQTTVKDANVYTIETVTLEPSGWYDYQNSGVYRYDIDAPDAARLAEDIDVCLAIDADMIAEAARCRVACTSKYNAGSDVYLLEFTAYAAQPTIALTYNIRVWANNTIVYDWDSETLTLTIEEK